MTRSATTFATLFFCGCVAFNSSAQTPSRSRDSDASELLALTRKIDEQSTKIDALSQQLLRLQQEIGQMKSTPSAVPVATAVAVESSPAGSPQTGSTHVVSRGETLTSIAKMHKVTIEELQKFNHITDDRKLQIGQTLVIPSAQNAAPAPSATPTPNE